MRQIVQFSIFVLIVASYAFAQPSIDGVVNAASYLAAPKDASGASIGNNVIAQGSYFVIFGKNLGPTNIAIAGSLPFGTSLPDANGTSVSITSGGKTVSAFMYYTVAGQVSGILPSNTPTGQASMTVTYNGQTSKAATISVAATSLGIFTQNQGGTGPASALVFVSQTSAPLMKLTAPAQPGQTLELFGTGLGAISGPDNVPPGAVQVGSNVVVTVGGKVIPTLYAGRAPQFPGEDQINFTLPSDVSTGCYVPASVTVSGQVSQDFALEIAPAGAATCTHPFGLSASALATLDAGGTVNVGVFQVLRAFLAVLGGSVEGAGGLFDNVNANGVFQMYNRIPVAFGTVSYPTPANGCVAVDQLNTGSGFTVPDFSLIGGKELVADAVVMTMNGPGGQSGNVLRQDTGGYLGVFIPAILGPGSWALTGSGGVDVGALNAKIILPDNLDWPNRGNFATPPRTDLTISWTGGTIAGSNPTITVFGNSTVVNATDPSKTRGKSFYCSAPVSAGRLVVPQSITSQLPSSATASGETAFGSLGMTTGGFTSFTAPLTKGTLDAAVIGYGEAIVTSVKYQ